MVEEHIEKEIHKLIIKEKKLIEARSVR